LCTEVALPGAHQAHNAAVAAGVAWMLEPTLPSLAANLEHGLGAVRWPGRLERFERGGVTVLLDAAHNPPAVAALAAYLDELQPAALHLVFGAMDDKPWRSMLDVLAARSQTRHYLPAIEAIAGRRPALPDDLARHAPGTSNADAGAALQAALDTAGPGEVVLVTGSIFVVGAVRGLLSGEARSHVVPL
jgi:dihydrofolate synthase/folylpolyglutamate synthase